MTIDQHGHTNQEDHHRLRAKERATLQSWHRVEFVVLLLVGAHQAVDTSQRRLAGGVGRVATGAAWRHFPCVWAAMDSSCVGPMAPIAGPNMQMRAHAWPRADGARTSRATEGARGSIGHREDSPRRQALIDARRTTTQGDGVQRAESSCAAPLGLEAATVPFAHSTMLPWSHHWPFGQR